MRKKIKICGIQSDADITIMNTLKPDFIGYVFYPKSKRYVEPSKARALNRRLDPSIRTVGVFVNESVEKVTETVHQATIDIVQLHGDEDEAYVNQLRNQTDAEIIKVFRVKDGSGDFPPMDVDYYLFDSRVKAYGGVGQTFDWNILKTITLDKPIILAGGIGADNIGEALRTQAAILDVSSAVEVNGKKDFTLTKNMIETLRRYTA
ncbi:MAG: phosphoribosylanthranilate isomerase [Bacillota bacterium]